MHFSSPGVPKSCMVIVTFSQLIPWKTCRSVHEGVTDIRESVYVARAVAFLSKDAGDGMGTVKRLDPAARTQVMVVGGYDRCSSVSSGEGGAEQREGGVDGGGVLAGESAPSRRGSLSCS